MEFKEASLTYCAFLIMVLGIADGAKSSSASKTGVIPIARCRSRCLAKFMKPSMNHDGCSEHDDCYFCWRVCETIFSNYDVWKETCKKKKFCKTGCQVACQFHKTLPKSSNNELWRFNESPGVVTENSMAFMAWNQPIKKNTLSDIEQGSKHNLVYVLLARDKLKKKGNAWQQVMQTESTQSRLDVKSLPNKPEFWMLAVGEYGTVAQIRFNTTVSQHLPFDDIREIPPYSDGHREPNSKGTIIMNNDSTLVLTMNMDISNDGRLKPKLSWTNPQVVPPGGSTELVYAVDYTLDHCECDLPLEHFAETVITDTIKNPKITLQDIAFNAVYKVEVYLHSDPDWKGDMELFTPDCPTLVSDNPFKCQQKITVDPQILIKTTTTLPTTVTDRHVNGSIRTTDPQIIMDPDEKTIHFHDWNITTVDMKYDATSHHVFVTLKWPVPFNHSKVTQEIVWTNLIANNHLDAGRTEHITQSRDTATEVLKLKPNNLYNVYIEATYMDGNNIQRSIKSRNNQIDTNITTMMPHARQSAVESEKDILNGIILGVTLVSSVILFGIIILFIYKKRQSFRDIIITKTAVAKSNSYKSNVGCKVDYSNQMLITSDDWEIDCRQLKFASSIGQGAFGKVVTGYYQDQRVAIKLVRDCAPLSYKEDLLAEINLMKRLDSHPNIVSMIGAVTMMEPICLVMEYVPYGNLQNFLKKCRLEGEVTVQAGRSPELNYSLMDEHGGLNEGVVTPADLLSFARQVTMAMEYLGAKRYVHRDLAARNVLLGYDRIIKVCDFGLSRDIFNDSQYKKLTNGKLPLKWMAIESLRDRVFTELSDVWSFGILLWEIVTMGASPYPNIALADLYYLLSNHYRMEKPSNCSDEIYIIMRQCWLDSPTDRPSFTDLRVQLELLLSRDRNYFDLDNIDIPLSTPESSSGSPVSDDTASLLAAKALQPQRKSSKDELKVDMCIHEKSVEQLLKRKGDFDLNNITIL